MARTAPHKSGETQASRKMPSADQLASPLPSSSSMPGPSGLQRNIITAPSNNLRGTFGATDTSKAEAHVSLMALSVTATAIAFILVFSYAQDWSGGVHPVLGCLVMILSLIQPIVAAFRCEPQHERRFVFNWAHSVIALAIKSLAVAAIFTGLALFEEYKEDGWMLKVMGGFITWEALMYILQDLNFRAKKKDSEICSCGSMKPETVLLILFLMGNLAFLISLLVGIGRS